MSQRWVRQRAQQQRRALLAPRPGWCWAEQQELSACWRIASRRLRRQKMCLSARMRSRNDGSKVSRY